MTRESLHELIDRIPEEEIAAAQRFLEVLAASAAFRAARSAPPDGEPITSGDAEAIARAQRDIQAGKGTLDAPNASLDSVIKSTLQWNAPASSSGTWDFPAAPSPLTSWPAPRGRRPSARESRPTLAPRRWCAAALSWRWKTPPGSASSFR